MYNPLNSQYLPNLYARTQLANTASSVSPLYTVASLQEVRMAQPNYDGTPIYFLVSKDNSIVVKQMDLNGLVVLKTYREDPPTDVTPQETKDTLDNDKEDVYKYIDKKLDPILKSLSELNTLISKKEDKSINVSDDRSKSDAGINGNDERRESHDSVF